MDYKKIWDTHHDSVYRYLLKRSGDEELSKDLLQEVFLKVHTKGDELRDPSKLGSWIMTIATNELNAHYRGSNKMRMVELNDTADDDSSEQSFHLEECMKRYIKEMPVKYEEVLEYYLRNEGSLKELSKAKGDSYSTIKSRFQRAKDYLHGLIMACCRPLSDKYGNIVELNETSCTCGCGN